MEILLRKTKITSSILKQVFELSLSDLKNKSFNSLGWCVDKDKRKSIYMVFQDQENNLKKFLFFQETSIEDTTEQIDQYGRRGDVFYLYIGFQHTPNSLKLTFKQKEERDKIKDIFESLKKDSLEKGQFFI